MENDIYLNIYSNTNHTFILFYLLQRKVGATEDW